MLEVYSCRDWVGWEEKSNELMIEYWLSDGETKNSTIQSVSHLHLLSLPAQGAGSVAAMECHMVAFSVFAFSVEIFQLVSYQTSMNVV